MTKFKKAMNSFDSSVKKGVVKTFDFKSRSSRSEFWTYNISLNMGVNFIFKMLEKAEGLLPPTPDPITLIFYLLELTFFFLYILSFLSNGARRLRDINRSPWWLLFYPTIIGIPVLIYFFCKKSLSDENQSPSSPVLV